MCQSKDDVIRRFFESFYNGSTLFCQLQFCEGIVLGFAFLVLSLAILDDLGAVPFQFLFDSCHCNALRFRSTGLCPKLCQHGYILANFLFRHRLTHVFRDIGYQISH